VNAADAKGEMAEEWLFLANVPIKTIESGL
jgi:hypothetical protein